MKKPLAFVLVLVLCTALLCSCGTSKKNSSSSQRPQSSSSVKIPESTSGSTAGSGTIGASQGTSESPGTQSGMNTQSMPQNQDTGGGTDGKNEANSNTASAAAWAAAEAAWFARLVNAQNPLPEDFTVETRAIAGYDERLFDVRAADALENLLHAAQENGTPLYLVSTYRSVARQKALFARKVNNLRQTGLSQAAAEQQAAAWVARPGTSEHNLGLAADIVSADWYKTHSDLTQEFEQTAAFAWLVNHCTDYGFILRYPKGRLADTGIEYEPWHYRYVGVELAKYLAGKGLVLEEYWQ